MAKAPAFETMWKAYTHIEVHKLALQWGVSLKSIEGLNG